MANNIPTRYELQKIYFSHAKFPWKYPAFVLVLTAADMILLVFFLIAVIESIPIAGIILLHTVFGAVLYVVRKFSSPQTKNISPMLFIILPGIGALIYGISYLSLYLSGARQAMKEVKHLYNLEVEIRYDKSSTIDFSQVAKLMDMSGVFRFSSSFHKKQMIIDLLSLESIENYKILKEGLKDGESEVVHYTASALNYLEEHYEKAIQKARDCLAEELSEQNFDHLVKLYENYINSGLLDEEFLPFYRKKIIDVLELQVTQFGPDLKAVKHLAKVYLAQGEEKKAYETIMKVYHDHITDLELQIIIIHYFYNNKEFDQIIRRSKQLASENLENLTDDQKKLILFWADQEVPDEAVQ